MDKVSPIYHTNVMMHVGTDLAVDLFGQVIQRQVKNWESSESSPIRQGKFVPIMTKPENFNLHGNMLERQ